MPEFGELLRRLRGERSQRQVAAELGMPVTTLSTLENQTSVPRGAVLQKLADYYAVPSTYFYPSVPGKMKPSDTARQWLARVRQDAVQKSSIATYAPIDFPEEVKQQLAEKIRLKKHASPSDIR